MFDLLGGLHVLGGSGAAHVLLILGALAVAVGTRHDYPLETEDT